MPRILQGHTTNEHDIYTNAIKAWVMSGRAEAGKKMLDVLAEMHIDGVYPSPSTYSVFLHHFASQADTATCEALFAEMKNRSVPIVVSHLSKLVFCHTTARQPGRAEAFLNEMFTLSITSDEQFLLCRSVLQIFKSYRDFVSPAPEKKHVDWEVDSAMQLARHLDPILSDRTPTYEDVKGTRHFWPVA
jgi:hypothetical protein